VNSRIIAAIGLALTSLLTPLQSQAAATTPANYSVELVVFRNLMPDLEGKEIWSPDRVNLNIPELDQARNAADSNDENTDIGKAVVLLQTNDKYQVLTHKRWIQTADARSSSPVMRITDPAGDLDGTVVFYMSRFLHVDVDLLLKDESEQKADAAPALATTDSTPPATASASAVDAGINNQELAYRIDESRRIRSNQMNYFDHPKFGVLLIITPMES